MPMYETAPVVFEIGSAYTKVGFVAEAYPRFIIPTEIQSSSLSGTTKNLFAYKDKLEFYDQMVDFIQTLFFKYVLVNPKERKIIIVENVLCPTEVREVLAKVLFRHFEVFSVLFVPTHLVVLSTLAVETALVVDLGYKEATILPVYSGVQVLRAWQAQPIAAEAVHAEITRQLLENGVSSDLLTDETIEDIKVRTCFVTTYERAQSYKTEQPPSPAPDVDYPIMGKEIITIPGVLRETAFEVLFPEDNDRLGLPFIILDAICACPLDMRKQLIENIVLVGGTAMATGLRARLKEEILAKMQTNVYKEKLFLNAVKFHNVPAKENFCAWLGGSIYGGTDILQSQALTKEMYSKLNRVPDWTNLEDNRPWGN